MAQLLHVRVPLVSAATFSGAAAAGSPAAAGCCLRSLAWRAALPAPLTASAAGGKGAARTCSCAPTESAGAAAAARGSAPALPAAGEAKAAGTFLQQKGPEAAIAPASVPCRRNKDSRYLQHRFSACRWLSPRSKRTGCSSSCDTASVSGTTGGGSGSAALRQEEKRLFPLSHQQRQKQKQLLGSRTGTSVPQWRSFSSGSAAAAAAGSSYDVVVVGGGPGGYVAAIKAAQLGLRTACVEKRGALGGTCLNVGCIPSKAVLNISNKFAEAREHFSRYGIMGVTKESLSVDITKVQQQKQRIVKTLTQGIEFLFKKNQVHYIIGEGKLADPHTVAVTSSAGGAPTRLEAKNIILATGSEPSPLPGNCVPIDEKVILSSTGALEMPAVPRHLAVIGGGVIGLELGSVWRNFGAEVTVIEFLDRLLPPVDGEVAKAFHKEMQKIGINFQLGTKVVGADVRDDSATLHLEPAQGGERFELEADAVLLAVGRRPFTKDLGLEELGIEKDKAGRLIVDSSFGTRRYPHIKAIGDLIPGPMLAHKAEEEGIACVEMIAGSSSGHVNYHTIPSVVYTHPEIAGVGKTEEELKKEGVNYAKGKFPFAANSRARCIDVADGFVKILTEKETDKILGAWIMGPEAGELVAQLVLALEYGASAEDLGRTCTAHPTLSEAVKEACMACYDKPIHVA